MQLRPIKANVYFTYQCPKCGSEISQSYDEVSQIGKFLCYGCHSLLQFEKMTKVNIIPSYGLVQPVYLPKKPENIVNKAPRPNFSVEVKREAIIGGLTRLGYSAKQAKVALAKVELAGGRFESDSELFKAVLREII